MTDRQVLSGRCLCQCAYYAHTLGLGAVVVGGLGISEIPEHHPFWLGGRLLPGEDPQDKEFPEVSGGAVGVPSAREGVHRRRGRGSRPPHAAPSCVCVCVGGVLPRSLRVNRSNTPTLMQL